MKYIQVLKNDNKSSATPTYYPQMINITCRLLQKNTQENAFMINLNTYLCVCLGPEITKSHHK